MFATSATRAYFDVNVLLISYLTFYRMSCYKYPNSSNRLMISSSSPNEY
jgi:hypothetical protein